MTREREEAVDLANSVSDAAEKATCVAIKLIGDAYIETIKDTYRIIEGSRPFLWQSNVGNVLVKDLPLEEFTGDFKYFPMAYVKDMLLPADDLAVSHKDGILVIVARHTRQHDGPKMVYVMFDANGARMAGTNKEISDTKSLSTGNRLEDARAALELAEWVRAIVEKQSVSATISPSPA